MNTKGKTSNKESKTKMTPSGLMRLAGISAVLAGLCFIIIGMFHQENVPASVITATWVNVHIAATALGFFGLFGIAGLYARQAEKSGWLGLTGFLMFSVWLFLISGFSFIEAVILPRLTVVYPAFVEGFLGIFSGTTGQVDFGILPTLSKIADIMYLAGPLLFGIATFRAGVLPRWAGALFVAGSVLAPVGAFLVPHEHQALVMLPNGLAMAWLGLALIFERHMKPSSSLIDQRIGMEEVNNIA